MLELGQARTAIMRELDGAIDRLEQATGQDWNRPVRCEGWRVLDLAFHLADAPRATADACRRMLQGIDVAGDRPDPPAREPDQIIRCLRAGRAELDQAMEELTTDSLANRFPLYFITLPGPFGLHLTALEIGTHRNDLAWALADEQPLPPDIIDAAAVMVPHILLFGSRSAAAKPAAPFVFKLSGEKLKISLRFEREWSLADDPSLPSCEITGDDSAIALFALGRIDLKHPSIAIAGEVDDAASFKTFFPGP
jgi:uncharacterized protein (TIGR03083 family)